MPDVTYFNYPYNQYVFTASQLKRVLLAQQGCDATPSYLALNGPRYPPILYGFGGAFFGSGCSYYPQGSTWGWPGGGCAPALQAGGSWGAAPLA